MKNFLIFTNIVLLGIIAYLLFFRKDTIPDKTELIPPENLKGRISFEAAELISHLYGQDSSKATTTIIGDDGKPKVVNNTKSVSFTLKGLNDFLSGIELAAKKINCTKPLGVKIYFSKYPDAETMRNTPTLEDVPIEYANKLTFFFVPTILDGNQYRDFNPAKWTDCENPPYYTKKGDTNQQFKSTLKNNDDDWMYNHGDLIPPPLPGDEFPPTTN